MGCYNPHVYKVVSPYYMFKFLKNTRISGWMFLGGILLCITGKHCVKNKLLVLSSSIVVQVLYFKLL